MDHFYQLLLSIHSVAGMLGLLVFWLPLLVRKGGARHRRFGAVFTGAMQVAGASAVIMTLMLYAWPLESRAAQDLDRLQQQQLVAAAHNLAGLLLPLGLLLLANTRQAVLVLRHKQDRAPLRRPGHQLLLSCLALAGLHLLYLAIVDGGVLRWVFALLCIGNALNIGWYLYRPQVGRREWLAAHVGNILGAGIGAHTAFLVFGGRSFLAQWVTADLQLWLWLAPSILGGTAIALVSRRLARA